ncbi:MAG TPA: ATP-binding protein [Streptosporangiaceae bacterium]|nr:ATP-binding protein [Streptosporangiaceae bacterium]
MSGTESRHIRPATHAAATWTHVFPARAEQVRHARKLLALALDDCPMAEEIVLCLSEFASNSVLHSASREPGGVFTVRAEIHHGERVHIEVRDRGGPWRERLAPADRPHGLDIVRAVAAECGVDGSALTGWTAWARFDWPG